MKLKEIIAKVDKTNPKLKEEPSWEALAQDLRVEGLYNSDDIRLTSYWMKIHYCTDTWVGWKAYYLDNELVCISEQVGRKWDEEFEYVSKESAKKLKEYLISLVQKEDEFDNLTIMNEDEEHSDKYSIEYSSQIMGRFHKTGLYLPTNEEVEIIKTFNDYVKFHEVIVKFPNGEEKEIDCRDLRFDYCKTF
jgi:hypothetical protein